MNTPTALYDYFNDNERNAASNARFVHTSSINSVGYLSNIGGNSFKEQVTSHIYVYRPFVLNNVNFDVDDVGALYINGNYITGQNNYNGGAGTNYSYSFKVGWHRLDLIYYEGGGGDYIKLGWNPAQYQDFISAMTPFGPQDRIITMGGNVGIGTLNPSTTLDVVGVIRGTTLSSLNIFTSNISSFFYGGIEKYNYISTTGLQSTITGLGTFGYISSLSLQSTVRTLERYYSIITLSTTANLSVSSLTFVEINTNSTTSLYYRSSMIYVGNNILYGALQYTPQFITF